MSAQAPSTGGRVVGLIAGAMLALAAALPAAERPNIVLILADDLGYGDLSCHGNPVVRTPNIDRLAADGVRFTDFQVSPLCSPTRCALMTGRHEYRSGVHQTRGQGQNMDLRATTIAQVLQSAGYATGHFGKWHLGVDEPYRAYRRGFDLSLSFSSGMIGEGAPAGMDLFDGVYWRNGTNERTQGFCTDVFFREAASWIGQVRTSGPFFAFIAPNAPHTPLGCPPAYEAPYAQSAPTAELATYYGMIANLDENVGRLRGQLDGMGLGRSTLLVFLSDNGANAHVRKRPSPPQFFNAGMKGTKGSVEEGGTRVPSFWSLPALGSGGAEVARLASAIDVFPTLAELAGAAVPETARPDGRSLVPLLRDAQAAWPDRMIFIHASNWGGDPARRRDSGFAVRSERFRLVGDGELYDVKADRGQTRNLIAEHAEEAQRMRSAYDAWWGGVLPALQAVATPDDEEPDDDAKPRRKRR